MVNNMKYAVDEIIDDIAILENIETGKKEEVKLNYLPSGIKEGNILLKDRKYKKTTEIEKKRREVLQTKLDNLKRGIYE